MAVYAAGTVLWRASASGLAEDHIEVALVHRPRYDDWSLPKGKVKRNETSAFTAVREVMEETGFRCELGRKIGRTTYLVAGTKKVVDYFSARCTTGAFSASDEVDEVRWLPLAEALSQCSYANDREILLTFTELPAQLSTVLLVRHAKAGDRATWQGEDDLRSLSKTGQEQAAALRKLAPLFGVDRVYSAPLTRCVQTVQRIADDLEAAITMEPLFSEKFYWCSRAEACDHILSLATMGGTPVISSQGGVIPDLVTQLALRAGRKLTSVQAKKGSIWVLSFIKEGTTDKIPALVAADYLPSPLPKPK